jgi:hypothetical protein
VADFFLAMLARAGSLERLLAHAIRRTTLCAWRHERALHPERTLRIRGRAPDGLVFALGPEPAERFGSGNVRIP